MPTVATQLLTGSPTLTLLTRLAGVKHPVRKGITTQKYVAYELFKDLEAEITHGTDVRPDVLLSSKEAFEVKYVPLEQRAFINAFNNYLSRERFHEAFITVSACLLLKGKSFKDWEDATLATGVIMVTKVTSTTKAEDIYKEAMEQLRKKIPEDMELVGLEPEDVIQYLNLKRIQNLEEHTSKLTEQHELLRNEVETLRTDMTEKVDTLRSEMTEKVDTLRTDISEKIERLETLLKELLTK